MRWVMSDGAIPAWSAKAFFTPDAVADAGVGEGVGLAVGVAEAFAEGEAEREGGGAADSAQTVKLRAEYEASIAAAPAQVVPSAGLRAAVAAARRLPVAGGRWDEITRRPFLDDPVNRGANFGTGFKEPCGVLTFARQPRAQP